MIEQLVIIVLLAFLAAAAIAVVRLANLFAAVMLFGVYSLLSASIFLTMDAADVAFTEASVGAGISTVMMLATLALTGAREKPPSAGWHRNLRLLVVGITGVVLVWGTLDMPGFGDPDAPAQRHVAPRYLQESGEEVGIPNVVSSVLASYRGFDTLGEVIVVFTAGLGVLLLLGTRGGSKRREEEP